MERAKTEMTTTCEVRSKAGEGRVGEKFFSGCEDGFYDDDDGSVEEREPRAGRRSKLSLLSPRVETASNIYDKL